MGSRAYIACEAAINLCDGEAALNEWKLNAESAFKIMHADDLTAVKRLWQSRVKKAREEAPNDFPGDRPSNISQGDSHRRDPQTNDLGIGEDEIPY